MELIEENPSGGAIFRFLTVDCGFKSEVTERSYSNAIKERLKAKKQTLAIETIKSVADCFKNN